MTSFNKLSIAKINKFAESAILVEFTIPDNLKNQYDYQPGQHLTLKHQINGSEYRRPYSICQKTHNGLRVAIRSLRDGVFSSWMFDNSKVGMELEVMTPQGEFKLDSSMKHQVFFAAGCGITPIISLMRQAFNNGKQVFLFYGNKTLAHSMFTEELEDLKNQFMANFNLYYLFTQELQTVDWLNGRLNKLKVTNLINQGLIPVDDVSYYICGPTAMIEDIKNSLSEFKISNKNIHFENFGTDLLRDKTNANQTSSKASSKASNTKNLRKLSIKLHGKTTEVFCDDSSNILASGLNAKLDLPYACQAGVCGTCKCKLKSGKVSMNSNWSLEDYDLKQGFILSCQSTPTTEDVVVDFDN